MGRMPVHDHPILKNHTRAQIAEICSVSYSTVRRWLNENRTPQWAIEKLGYITVAPKQTNQIENILCGFRDIFKESYE